MTADGGTNLSSLDTKKKSASEEFINSFGSNPLRCVLEIIILPIFTRKLSSNSILICNEVNNHLIWSSVDQHKSNLEKI